VIMDQGRIVEQGTHDSLLQQNGPLRVAVAAPVRRFSSIPARGSGGITASRRCHVLSRTAAQTRTQRLRARMPC